MVFDSDGNWLQHCVSKCNLRKSQEIWQLIFTGPWAAEDYQPIDWQRDFRSGMHWDARVWFMDVAIGKVPRADIKVPWELARLQQLPLLALRACSEVDPSEVSLSVRRSFVVEIRSQVLDFIATNPPRFGIHWRTPMELAIRSANLLLCLDILQSGGVSLDEEAMQVIHDFLDTQTRHILANLEWSENERGNHYYANLLGILFVACYLPSSPERNAWKAFAIHELHRETGRQFLNDGGSFEGSTGYHRLTLEMAIYAVALVCGLDEHEKKALQSYDHKLVKVRPPFPPAPLPWFDVASVGLPFSLNVIKKVVLGVRFLRNVERPDKRFTQIGDVDSSRFFKLQPLCRDGREDAVSIQGVIGAAAGVFPDFKNEKTCLDEEIVIQIANRKCLVGIGEVSSESNGKDFAALSAQFLRRFEQSKDSEKRKTVVVGEVPCKKLRLFNYPDFGVYLLKGPSFHLCFRCFDYTNGGAWGHAHDDNLSLELMIDGRPVVTDPGSFVYTADPELRELYRGVSSHFAPRAIGYPAADTSRSLFSIKHLARAKCHYSGKDGFIARLEGDGWAVERMINVEQLGIMIWDRAIGADLEPYSIQDAKHSITDGYGRETQNPICTF